MTDDVTWPWKVKVVTPICSGPYISKTAGDSQLQWNTYRKCYIGVSNGHMLDDVTWPQKVKVVTPIYLEPNISKTLGDRDLFQWSTNRKPYIGNRIVTWSMTSRDLERSRSWHQYVQGPISRKRLEIVSYNGTPIGNAIWGYQMVTCSMTSRDPKRSRSWPRYISSRISC